MVYKNHYMSTCNYEICLQFPSVSKLGHFLRDFENWTRWQHLQDEILARTPAPVPAPAPKPDNRGKHTAKLHQLTREYQALHPLIPYHECMRLCRNTI